MLRNLKKAILTKKNILSYAFSSSHHHHEESNNNYHPRKLDRISMNLKVTSDQRDQYI